MPGWSTGIAPGAGRFFVYPKSHLIDMARNGAVAVVTVTRDGREPLFQGTENRALFALRERASYFGGTIEVVSAAGETAVQVRFPLNPAGQ